MNICVIQARLHSQRLPCKALASILGEPLIQYVIQRARWMTTIDRVVLAVPPADMASFAKVPQRVTIYSPNVPEQDVLARYTDVARQLELKDTDRIVRVTGDCPGLDPRVSDAVVRLAQNVDYASNTRDWPDGLDTEVFTVGLLRAADKLATTASDREHVTPWMRHDPRKFAELALDPPQRWRKWSVDDERDLEYVRELFKAYGKNWGWRQAVQLDSEPGLICEYCAAGCKHPQRSLHSIGGVAEITLYDLHEVEVSGGVGYVECTAHEVVRRHAEHSTVFPPATPDKSSGPSADLRGTASP